MEKRPYTAPPPSSVKVAAKPATRPAHGSSAGNGSLGNDEWGEWGGAAANSQVCTPAALLTQSSYCKRYTVQKVEENFMALVFQRFQHKLHLLRTGDCML